MSKEKIIKKPKILYKSLPADRKPHGFQFKKGVWYKAKGKLEICNNGFHASRNIIDAMDYVNCGYIAKVEVRGKSIIEDDKECWQEMRVVEWHKWTKKDSVFLAIFASELVLDNFEKKYPNDKRPRKAIEAAKKVLKNNTEKNRSAAESAAWSAERNAASAARSAARSAERSAASAAWSAARSAERSAERRAVILNKCHKFVIKRKLND